MSNTHEQLSPRELYLIESYKEQTAAWRHENDLLYRFTTITLPVSIAALGVPYVQDKVPDLLATLGGLTLMTFWAFSCQIMQIKSNLRFSVINEIEKYWRTPSHKDCRVIKENTYGKKGSDRLRSHFLRCWLFWIYLGIVMVLTWCKWRGPCCAQKVLTTETIDSIVIGLFLLIAVLIVSWAMCKARKDVWMNCKDKTDPTQNGS